MPTVILENDEEHEHEQVRIHQGLVKGEVDRGSDRMADIQVQTVYPESSVRKIEVGDDGTVIRNDTEPCEYKIQ